MCIDCGCQEANEEHFQNHNAEHTHDHSHEQTSGETTTIKLEEDILSRNNRYAAENRAWLKEKGVSSINIISSPGSGKTALLEATLEYLKKKDDISIIVGDQQTSNDATRLSGYGANVKQINTHSSCHLDAHMIAHVLKETVTKKTKLLIIENVGNLVCPAAFDLGADKTIALLSTTEGEDKPVKYPVLFNKADLILLTKSDLIPYLDWDEVKCRDFIGQVNYQAEVIMVSSRSGEGMEDWLTYLQGVIS